MKRVVALLMVAALMAVMLALAGPASATSENASDRACVGAFVSAEASPSLGGTVSEETQEFHPLGQTIVAPFASTCENPEEE